MHHQARRSKPHIRLRQSCPTILPAPAPRTGSVTDPGYHRGRVSPTKGKRYPPTPPTRDEALLIFDAFPDSKVGRRNRCLSELLYRTGLRINEALSLVEADLDLTEHTITIRNGKGNKSRIVGIDEPMCRQMRAFLQLRADEWACRPQDPIFCSLHEHRRGGRMLCGTYREALAAAAKRAGIRKRISPHGWRHALASELMRDGVPLSIISRQLGHTSEATTAVYLRSICPAEVVDIMATRAWPVLNEGTSETRRRLLIEQAKSACRAALDGLDGSGRGETPDLLGALTTVVESEVPAERIVGVYLVRRPVGPPAARVVRNSGKGFTFRVDGEMTVSEFRQFGDLIDQALTDHLEFTMTPGDDMEAS